MKGNLRGNIPRLYLIKVSHWLMLVMPVIVPFYEMNHLTAQDVLTLQAVYSISTLLLEIPSGYFADVYGRKNSLILGAILGTAGFGVYCFSDGFWGFLAAEIVLGLGQSFISGADSALMFDTLTELGENDRYMKLEGKNTSLGNFAEASAGLLAGLIATMGLRTNFIFQTGVAFLAIPAALSLVEPGLKSRTVMKVRDILKVVSGSFTNSKLRWNILFSASVGSATLTMAWFAQYYFKELGFDVAAYGVLWTILNCIVGVCALLAYKFERKTGVIFTSLAIGIVISSGFFLTGTFLTMAGLSFLFIFYAFRGLATPVLKDYINRLTSSETRATVLSVRNFCIRIIFSIMGPLCGWFYDLYGFTTAMYLAGAFSGTLILVTMVLFLNSIRKKTLT